MPEIRLALTTDASGAIKGIKTVEDGLENVDKKAKKSQSTLDDYAKKLAAAFSVVKIASFMDAALRAQAEQEAAINKLNLALANQGNFTEKVSASLRNYAAELQRTTTFSTGASLSVMGMFASFGFGENDIKRATKAATDFAAATGKSLDESAASIAKASTGNVSALQKMGFQFDDTMTRGQKFESALKQIEQRFGGSAEAATATYIGQVKQLENAWGDAQEALGKFLGELLGGEKPFSVMIEAADRLAKVFSVDLVLALNEARVKLLEFEAANVERAARVNRWLAEAVAVGLDQYIGTSVQGKYLKAAAGAEELAKSLRAQITALREQGDRAALSAGNLLKFGNSNKKAAGDAETLTEALKRQKKALEAVFNFVGPMPPTDIERLLGDSFARAQMARPGPATDLVSPQALKALYEISGLYTVINQKTGLWTRYQDVVNQELENAATITERISSGGLMGSLAKLPSIILGALQGGGDVGRSIGASLGSDLGTSLGNKITPSLMRVLGPGIGAALGAAMPGIGAALGSVAGEFIGRFLSNMTATKGKILGALLGGPVGFFLGGFLGGQAEHKRVNDLRDAFMAAAGGIDALRERAHAAGLTLERLLNAKTVKDYQAAIEELTDAFDLQKRAQEKLDATIAKYGFTIAELGPKWGAQKLNEKALELFEDYQLLIGAGIEYDAVIARMGPAINEYIQTAIGAGIAIPEAWRPIIQRMIDNKQLLDKNGVAYENLEATGIEFTESLNEQFKKLLDSIKQLVDALNGIPNINRTVTITTQYPGGGGPGNPNPPEAASGWHGVVSGPASGYPAPFTMHGTERVDIAPLSASRAGTASRGASIQVGEIAIHVSGAGDPAAVARAVKAALRDNVEGLATQLR